MAVEISSMPATKVAMVLIMPIMRVASLRVQAGGLHQHLGGHQRLGQQHPDHGVGGAR